MSMGGSHRSRPVPDHAYFSSLIWQIADLLRGPYRPPQYERVMLPMTVLRRFDCVLASRKTMVLTEYERLKGGRIRGRALDQRLNKVAGQRFHNRSSLDFEKLKSDPDNVDRHLVSYIHGFSKNVRDIFEYFEFENEIQRMAEANILYLVVLKFAGVPPRPRPRTCTNAFIPFKPLLRYLCGVNCWGARGYAGNAHSGRFRPPVARNRLARRHLRRVTFSVTV